MSSTGRGLWHGLPGRSDSALCVPAGLPQVGDVTAVVTLSSISQDNGADASSRKRPRSGSMLVAAVMIGQDCRGYRRAGGECGTGGVRRSTE